MADRKRSRKGKRVMRRYDTRKRSGQRAAGTQSRQETEAQPRSKGSLRRLTVSAVLLVLVIAWKLLAPRSFAEFRGTLTDLIGGDQDFKAAFSAVGRAVDGEGELREVFRDTYVAVFGIEESQQGESQRNESPDLPPDAVMQQKILGFTYQKPVNGTIAAPFGARIHPIDGTEAFHYGLDIAADEGTVITSFADGKVTAVGESSSLGKYVVVLHENDYQTLYAHCSRVTASSGQQLRVGDPIAEVGQTGQTTGPHLHFELQCNTTYLNPIYYVAAS